MKKITTLLLFVLSLIIVSAIYIIGNMFYLPVYLLYIVIATISSCVYLWLFFHHNNEIGIAKMNGTEVPEELLKKRRNRLKIIIIVFLPFLLVVMLDSIYLLLIKDSVLLAPILKLFK